MLPLVRRIVADIGEQWRELEPLMARWQALPAALRVGASAGEMKAGLDARTAAVDELVGELQELGCYFKGFQEGLVDWYSLYAGRAVFLCWKAGEEEIAWWHQIDAGFSGRQPIPASQRGAFRGAE